MREKVNGAIFLALAGMALAFLSATVASCQTEHEHDWQWSKTVSQATCLQEGKDLYVCSKCNKKLELPTPLGEHTIGADNSCVVCDLKFNGTEGLEYTPNDDGYTVSGIGTAKATKLVIPYYYEGKKVTAIGDNAFLFCDKLTSVTIPSSVTSIGHSVFATCSSLVEIKVDGNNKNYCDENGILFNKDKTVLVGYPAARPAASYAVPDGVKEIGYSSFINAKSLVKVELPKGLKKIGERAFFGCENLKDVTIPDSVAQIGEWAFRNCSSLEYMLIPRSVVAIGALLFYNCENMTVFCEATARPFEWNERWNVKANNMYYPTYWYSDNAKEGGWRYVDGVPTKW